MDALARIHRTKYQESVNGNVAEICETVAETRRLTRVSAYTFLHVSVRFQLKETRVSASVTLCFMSGNTWKRSGNLIFCYFSVDEIRPKRSRKYKVPSRITFLPCFR